MSGAHLPISRKVGGHWLRHLSVVNILDVVTNGLEEGAVQLDLLRDMAMAIR